MAMERVNDVRAFRQFIDEQLSNGGSEMSLDETLARWDLLNSPDDERTASIQAVREALDDMRAGDSGVPAREALAELRKKHNLPELS